MMAAIHLPHRSSSCSRIATKSGYTPTDAALSTVIGIIVAERQLRDIRSHALAALERVDREVDGCRTRGSREVVERAARHDEQRQPGLSCHVRDRRDRAVAAAHADHARRIGAGERRAHDVARILALVEHVHVGERQAIGDDAQRIGAHDARARSAVRHDEHALAVGRRRQRDVIARRWRKLGLAGMRRHQRAPRCPPRPRRA